MRRLAQLMAVISLLLLGVAPALAEDAGVGLTLEQLEALAANRYPEVAAESARLDQLEAQLSEVTWRPFSGLRVQGTFSPTPERRGDANHSAQGDIYISDTWGVLFRLQVDLNLPLYGFGRLRAERDAARDEVDAGRAQVIATKRRVRARVQEAYYGLLLARNSESLLDEGRGYLERAERYVAERLDDDEGTITESDRLQLEIVDAEIEARQSDARRASGLALAALRTLASLEDEPIATPILEPTEQSLLPLERYLEASVEGRAESTVAGARTSAAAARRRLARASFFPEIRLVGNLDYAYSNVVDDQQTPFASDPFNHLRYGVGLQLHWDLDFAADRARFHQAEARLRQAQAEETMVRRQVTQEVEEAYLEVEANQGVVAARRRGHRASRGWLFTILQGIDVGVLDPPELVDALRAYFEQSFLYIEAVTRLNRSMDALELASCLTGGEAGGGGE